jgi:hypothetical protein
MNGRPVAPFAKSGQRFLHNLLKSRLRVLSALLIKPPTLTSPPSPLLDPYARTEPPRGAFSFSPALR